MGKVNHDHTWGEHFYITETSDDKSCPVWLKREKGKLYRLKRIDGVKLTTDDVINTHMIELEKELKPEDFEDLKEARKSLVGIISKADEAEYLKKVRHSIIQ